jgi:mono/diheme cytochrome c family protein
LQKRILTGAAAVAVLGLIGFAILAWRPAIDPIPVPSPASFPAEKIALGEKLAGAGFCNECHTVQGSNKPYAGGYAMNTGFGTIYSTNITPDPETGIGNWSEAAFRRAMHEGVARDGSHLFPAFPYDHFSKMSDADVPALYAYFMTRQAIVAPTPENELPFPLGIRAFQAGWKLLFFRPGRFQPDPAKSLEWNRGAYLAEGPSHCGACHTPRNLLGAEKASAPYAGAVIDNWIAPPLTAANPTPVVWNEQELYDYLRTGISRFHGTSAGPMGPVVSDGLAKLPDSDIRAIAIYFADVDGAAKRQDESKPAERVVASDKLDVGSAKRLYATACASCHYNGPDGPNPLRPELALNNAINLDDPTNLVQVMLHGINAKDGAPGVVMPAFKNWSDADLARVATYLRSTRSGKAPWNNLEKKIASIRIESDK